MEGEGQPSPSLFGDFVKNLTSRCPGALGHFAQKGIQKRKKFVHFDD
jgi:hypothetical protein